MQLCAIHACLKFIERHHAIFGSIQLLQRLQEIVWCFGKKHERMACLLSLSTLSLSLAEVAWKFMLGRVSTCSTVLPSGRTLNKISLWRNTTKTMQRSAGVSCSWQILANQTYLYVDSRWNSFCSLASFYGTAWECHSSRRWPWCFWHRLLAADLSMWRAQREQSQQPSHSGSRSDWFYLLAPFPISAVESAQWVDELN